MRTTINGKEAAWPPEVVQLWHTHCDEADPKLFDPTKMRVIDANYFTPRPYVDAHNRGSGKAGFTYSMKGVQDAGVPRVYQCSWFEEYDEATHGRYRHGD